MKTVSHFFFIYFTNYVCLLQNLYDDIKYLYKPVNIHYYTCFNRKCSKAPHIRISTKKKTNYLRHSFRKIPYQNHYPVTNGYRSRTGKLKTLTSDFAKMQFFSPGLDTDNIQEQARVAPPQFVLLPSRKYFSKVQGRLKPRISTKKDYQRYSFHKIPKRGSRGAARAAKSLRWSVQ